MTINSFSEIFNAAWPVLGIMTGFALGWFILRTIGEVLREPWDGPVTTALREDLKELPTIRTEPPPVPYRDALRECRYCGQVSKGRGPCPHCGGPR